MDNPPAPKPPELRDWPVTSGPPVSRLALASRWLGLAGGVAWLMLVGATVLVELSFLHLPLPSLAGPYLLFSVAAALLAVPAAIVGVILSGLALEDIRESGGQLGGERQARTGSRLSMAAAALLLLTLGAFYVCLMSHFPSQGHSDSPGGGPRLEATQHDLAKISQAVEKFKADCGRFPTTEEGLQALVDQPPDAAGWHGPYIKEALPQDPWGNPYAYRCPGAHNRDGFDLLSFGPDGVEDGVDDIMNWSP